MKNDSDQENYNREFQDLQMQIYDLAQIQFNGVSLFAIRDSDGWRPHRQQSIGDLPTIRSACLPVQTEQVVLL